MIKQFIHKRAKTISLTLCLNFQKNSNIIKFQTLPKFKLNLNFEKELTRYDSFV